MKSSPSLADYALLVLLAAIFGSSFLMTKVGVAEIPPVTFVACRFVIAAIILGLAMVRAGQRFPAWGSVWLWIAGAALFGNALPFFLITWGQVRVDAGLAAILMATMPLATIVLAHAFTDDEKLNYWKLLGVGLGILGVAVLMGLDKLATLGDESVRQYAIATAAVCYGVNAVITRKLVGLPRRATATAMIMVSLLMTLPFSLLLDRPWALTPTAGPLVALLAAGILPTAIGALLLFAIISRQGASFLGQINFLVPLFGVLWAWLFLSERLPANALLALGIILAGVAIARLKPGKSPLSPKRKLET